MSREHEVAQVVEVALLGGVRAHEEGGTPLDLGPPKCRLVLAALALRHGEPVPVTRLIDCVWGDDPPGTAPKILQGYVSRLRKALGAAAISTVGTAYRLERSITVDTTRFGRLVDDGDVEGALALWAGPPLAGLDPAGLQPAVDGLVERWLDATEQRLARLVDDDPGAAVARLTELVSAHPFREGLWASLVLALARTDRQADALAAVQRARRHLVDELGIDPGERLQALEGRILAGEVGPTPALPRRVDPDNPLPRPVALPAVPDLVGRDADVAVVLAALRTASLVTLLGPGGIGKTSLAVTVARAWHERSGGRVVLAELDEVTDGVGVVDAVAEVLGVAEPPDGDLRRAIVAATAAQPTLLVLDNCEHVLPAVATLVGAFGAGPSTTRLLATSRERLGAVREHLHPVEPLDPADEGAELFLRRASAVMPGLDLRPEREVVEELCRQLDGVPLAIELAAARTRSLTPTQLLERLGDRFRLLADRSAGSARQATLEGAVAWSHDLLGPDEQQLFARLSVFSGSFDLEAAEVVGAGDGLDAIDVDRVLGDLVERSMVTSVGGAGGRRFRLLETLRQFAATRLAEAGATAAVETRHAGWVRGETAAIGVLLTGPREADGVRRLDLLWPNLRAAVERAVGRRDVALADALLRPVVTEVSTRRRGELGVWAERMLGTGAADGDTVLFWLLWALHRHMQSGNRAGFEALVERYGHADHPLVQVCRWYLYEDGVAILAVGREAIAWLRAHGHDHAADHMEMTAIGSGLMTTGRLEEAVERFRGWVDRYATAGPPTFHYFALGFLGYTLQLQGDLEAARTAFLAAADVAIPPGTYAAARPAEVEAVFAGGEHDRARRLLLEHVDDVLAMGTVDVARLVAVTFVKVMVGLGRVDDAAPALAYLGTTGEFGEMARAALVADEAAVIGEVGPHDGDGVAALRQMRTALAALQT
ncbi:BTAD domain-containing putative transcriptional regulator [Euzebya rosea]|uniref:BTAD domain-containing putative transcriptional regulator n=1 Tax=Euzebya rosea TaxID=2052804 RepID=UPI00147515F2|nr:BTAD domain-containing putative transcriptional regulator [Euzebya rosea]